MGVDIAFRLQLESLLIGRPLALEQFLKYECEYISAGNHMKTEILFY